MNNLENKSYKVSCSCNHEYQDSKYGTKIRVATTIMKSVSMGKLTRVRCTVCSKEHTSWK